MNICLDDFSPVIKLRGDRRILVDLFFDANLAFFEGHFPGFSITPGVLQCHLAVQCANKFLNLNAFPTKIQVMKFMSPLRPNSMVSLDLSFDKNSQNLKFLFSDGEVSYSSGKIKTGEIDE